MQVAVAGVEDVGDLEAVAGTDLLDPPQHLRQAAGRDDAVHAEIVGEPAHRAEGGLAALPDRGAFGFRFRDADRLRLKALGDRRDAGDQVGDLGLRALDLDDQQRLDVERIAGMGEGLADLDRRPVHVFDRDRDDAARR